MPDRDNQTVREQDCSNVRQMRCNARGHKHHEGDHVHALSIGLRIRLKDKGQGKDWGLGRASKKSSTRLSSHSDGLVMAAQMRSRSDAHVSTSRAIGVLVRSRNTNSSTVRRRPGSGVNSFRFTCTSMVRDLSCDTSTFKTVIEGAAI